MIEYTEEHQVCAIYKSKARHQMRFLKLQSHFQACAAHSSFFNCSIKKKIKEIVTTTDQKQVLVVILYLPYSKKQCCVPNEISILLLPLYIKPDIYYKIKYLPKRTLIAFLTVKINTKVRRDATFINLKAVVHRIII